MRSFSWILPVLFLFVAASPAAALPALYAAGSARHAIRLPDGSIIVTGYFTTVGETARPGIAKLLPDGQLDEEWMASGLADGFAAQAVALAASPDGTALYIATNNQIAKIYTSGAGASVPGFAVTVFGSVDGGNSGIRALGVDGAGLVYVAGAFAYVNGQQRNGLARVSASGTLDAGWNASANSTVNAIEIDSTGGFVYAAGAFVSMNGATHLRIARLQLADGSIDAGWSPTVTSVSDGVHHIALSAARDSLVLAGNFSAVNSTARAGLARLLTSAPNLDAWNPATSGYDVEAIVANADYVYLGGTLGCCGAGQLARVAASSDGAIDAGWSPLIDGSIAALLADATHALLAFGDFDDIGGVPVLAAAALSLGATADHTLPDFEIEGSVLATASETSGALVMAGDFQKVDQAYRPGLFRLQADGSADPVFVPPSFQGGGLRADRLQAVAVDPGSGQVYAGGGFAKVAGDAHPLVVRLDGTSGALDPSWSPSVDAGPGSGEVRAIAVDAGAVYIGGSFSHVNGIARANLARLTAAGTLDAQNVATTNGAISRIAIDGDAIFIAGTFLVPRERVARLHRADGSFDPDWNPAFDWVLTWNEVFDLKAIGGDAYISTHASIPFGGGYVSVGEVVRVDGSGNAAPLARFNQPVYSILPAPDGNSLYVAGLFQTLYALDDFFAQTSRPAGLAQISLRPGTLGVAEAWSPSVPPASGVPGLASFGAGLTGVLAGTATANAGLPRPGLELLSLPPGDFLFRNSFEVP